MYGSMKLYRHNLQKLTPTKLQGAFIKNTNTKKLLKKCVMKIEVIATKISKQKITMMKNIAILLELFYNCSRAEIAAEKSGS